MASLSPNKRVEERYNNIIKSKNDDRLYRGLVLTNKMKVLLISDPTTIKSAAAIDISAGSICDPDYLPGLAHLCEHMLPLGTKKYPEQNEYGTYLSRNGGTSNALTGTYNATFFFDISSEKLEGALDRLAQFFIAPLFTETLVELELNAINSEYEKDLVNDEYRLNHVDKIFARPDHPLSKFTMGNRETLDIIPKQRGINVRNELLKFHKEYYSANIMALCILGKESLDELEEIVVDLFSEVQDKEIKFPTWPEHPFDEKHFHTIRYIVPIRDVRYLEITFLISDVWKHHLSLFPYVSHIFEHEGKGSLLSTLKARGWCNSLISHIIYGFIIAFYLTEEGIKHIENIVQLMFQYINMIYLKGPIKEIYDIYSLTVQKKFEFKEKSLPLDYVRFTVEALQKCPINNVLYARYILTEWQPDLINEIIKTLTPQNIISICVAAKAYEPTANKTERWFGTKYKEEKLSKETMDMWINAGYNEDLKLPYKNKYIPTTININSQINNNVGKFPIILKDTSFIRLWYKKDDEFLVPKTEMMFHFVSPFANISPLNCNLTYMFVQLLQDSLNEDIHAAALAGLESKLSCCNSGILLTIGGYDDKQYLLLTNIVNRMINFKTDPKRFEILKENYIRELKNWATKSLHEYISVYLFNLLVQHSLLEEELLEYTAHLSVDRLQQFIPQFFSNMYVECLIYGNVTVKEAINIVSLIESMLTARMSHLIPLQKQLTLNREIKLDNGCHFLFEAENKFHSGFLTTVYYPTGLQSTESNMLLELLAQIIAGPCFDILRTTEQLGYIVYSHIYRRIGSQGLQIVVQSNKHPQYVEKRIDLFIDSMLDHISTMSEEQFEEYKKAVTALRLQKPINLRHQCTLYWNEIASQQYNFDRVNIEVAFLKTITRQQLLNFFKENVYSKTRCKLSIHLIPTATENKSLDITIEETADSANENVKKIDDIMSFKNSQTLYPLRLKPIKKDFLRTEHINF